ncbi:Leucine--tRNA ligase [endosymbiont GvMRE of Glomus versiforme]|nr:leucine--tRNA ligase [endosymbiont GvMRE of Glomus versiforme]RHZ36916.1 Leucine--tRNA ligase [endosymbiont GvMRE of Glomus versiforme]
MSYYSCQEIEKKWQEYWAKNKIFFTDLADKNRPKKYILAMFPYPSGSGLHVGHIRNYTITDALARFYHLKGYNVLMPIGWDAFGLPAEQYAIQTNNHPATFTNTNIQNFKEQLLRMGFSYDWSKEINTSEPAYYHWTQWIFCQIYRQGLAEYKEIPVYWCEKLGTVLANEEIKTIDNKKVSERGNFPVVEKNIPQWVLKITQYAPQLLEDLAGLDWPKGIKSLQKNWIGLNQGTFINFPVVEKNLTITVFTKSPQTLYGVTALALSVNHPLITQITSPDRQTKINEFCTTWKDKESQEVHGEFTGNYAQHPLTEEKLPIWITNFVISEYGTGAVMINAFSPEIFAYQEIPNLVSEKELKQNKQIDYAFAVKYNLPIKKIFQIDKQEEKIRGYFINSPLINNLDNKEKAIEIINENLKKMQKGRKGEFYHLRDWIFSRQRYWGEPIPVIHWENNQKELLSEKDLPLILPPLTDFTPNLQYYSPLQKVENWANVENKDNLKGKRDVNVMPQWAGSCWYYIAFLLKKNDSYLALNSEEAKKIIKNWLPVDIYIGGQEHANLHLLYARFWHKVLYKIGIVSQPEPFQKLICQGMILGEDGEKMSKSRGNIINPDPLIKEYGVDALRLAMIFLAPPEQTTNFKLETVKAMNKWLKRVYQLFTSHKEKFTENSDPEWDNFYHEILTETTKYYQKNKLNLIIPQLMIFINKCYQSKNIPRQYALNFLQLLNPLAPHITEEIWSYFQKTSLAYQPWPEISQINENKFPKQINLIVQINGKTKTILPIDFNQEKERIIKEIEKNEKISKQLKNKAIIKIIYINNKIINFVCQ